MSTGSKVFNTFGITCIIFDLDNNIVSFLGMNWMCNAIVNLTKYVKTLGQNMEDYRNTTSASKKGATDASWKTNEDALPILSHEGLQLIEQSLRKPAMLMLW